MKYLLTILLLLWFIIQNSCVYSQETYNKKVKVESYFNMDTTLGVIFCGKLNHLVYNAALEGKIPVYKTSYLKPEEKLEKEQILKQGGIEEAVQMIDVNDLESEILIDTVVKFPFQFDKEVTGYYFSIIWQLAFDGYSYYSIPDAFSIAYHASSIQDSSKMKPLFWIKYSDLKKLLTYAEFHQLQEALFLHIYTNFNCTDHPKWSKEIFNEDLKINSSKKYFFNTRFFSGLVPNEWIVMNKRLYDDAINYKVTVYYTDSMQFGSIKTKEELSNFDTFQWFEVYDSTSHLDLDTSIIFETDTIPDFNNNINNFRVVTFITGKAQYPFNPKYNSVSEKWEMDYHHNKIIGQITGISNDYDIIVQGQNFGRAHFFYVPYKYVESVIGKAELLRMSNILFNSLIKNYLEK